MPSGFGPSEAHREFASVNAIDLGHEFRRFVNHHEAKGSVFASWSAALRTWLENAVTYRQQRLTSRPAGSGEVRAGDLIAQQLADIKRMEAEESE